MMSLLKKEIGEYVKLTHSDAEPAERFGAYMELAADEWKELLGQSAIPTLVLVAMSFIVAEFRKVKAKKVKALPGKA
jgi:hypothetical protein